MVARWHTHRLPSVQGGETDSLAVMDAGGGNRITLATIGPSAPPCVGGRRGMVADGKAIVFPKSPGCELFIVAADGTSRPRGSLFRS